MEYQFTDRYGGGPGPDLETMCKGQCEGLGTYPVNERSDNLTPWEASEIIRVQIANGIAENGYYFIRCEACDGTGKRPNV